MTNEHDEQTARVKAAWRRVQEARAAGVPVLTVPVDAPQGSAGPSETSANLVPTKDSSDE